MTTEISECLVAFEWKRAGGENDDPLSLDLGAAPIL